MSATLTPREKDVLRLLAQGNANKAIASKLGIELSTVKLHMSKARAKLGHTNRVQTAIWAHTNLRPGR